MIAYEAPPWLDDPEALLEAPEAEQPAAFPWPSFSEDVRLCDALVDCAKLAKDYKMQQEALAGHIRELQAKKKAKERAEQRLRRELTAQMRQRNMPRVKTPVCTVSISEPREQLRVINEQALPEEYWRVKREVNLSLLQDAFRKDGLIPDGCDVVTGEPGLTIRFR